MISTELDSTVAAMKRLGVLHFRSGEMEITLHPTALFADETLKKPENDPRMTVERGITGETRQDQLDKYGVVHEGDFPRK